MCFRPWCALFLVALATRSGAAEYLLTVEAVGYEDVSQAVADPPVSPLDSAEVLCRPGEPFLARTTSGPVTVTLSGELQPSETDAFRVQCEYGRKVDTGQTVPTGGPEPQKIFEIASGTTTAEVRLGEPFFAGELVGRSSDLVGTSAERHTQSLRRVFITLREHKSAAVVAVGADIPISTAGETKWHEPVSAPIFYGDQILVVATTAGVAAIAFDEAFDDGTDDPDDATPNAVPYRFRFLPAPGTAESAGEGKVFERREKVTHEGEVISVPVGDTKIEAGGIEVEWSRSGERKGWIYYAPETTVVTMAKGDRFNYESGGRNGALERLDLKRFVGLSGAVR